MEIAIIVAVFGLAALFVLFFLVKRMLRFAVRLVLASLLILILLAGGLFWWWYHSGDTTEQTATRPASPARRTSNAR